MARNYGAAVSQRGYDVKTCDDRFLVYSSAFQVLKVFSVFSVIGKSVKYTNGVFTVDTTTNVFTSNSHGLSNGDVLNFDSSGSLPAPLLDYTEDYYAFVVNATENTFQLSLEQGGEVLDITSAGSGTLEWYNDVAVVDINHNLGHIAPFIVVFNGNSVSGVANSYMESPQSLGQVYDVRDEYMRVQQSINKLRIFLNFDLDAWENPGESIYLTVYQFVDDFSTIEPRTINTDDTSGSSDDDYGFRISKEGFDVKDCDDIDCVLSSSFYTQIIHQKGVDTSGSSTITINHGLGYIPTFLIFCKENSSDDFIRLFTNVRVTDSDLIIENVYAYDEFYFIIFKQKNN